ncbi:MAG: transglutaminase-like domain-containing protein [Candidatus Pacearchaeota archaeon]
MRKSLMICSVFFVFLPVFLSFVSAEALDEFNLNEFNVSMKELKLSVNVSNTIHSDATKILANLTYFPREDERQQASLKTIPGAEQIGEEFILFNFSKKGEITFKVESIVNTKFFLKKVKKNVSLIGLDVPAELEDYIESSNYVALDPYIRNKARQLATKDAMETLYNLAEYVRNNMNYSLGQMEIKNSSWIMENKQGVCSHYTILFMALARSLGLPARFVAGVAYSNKDNKFGEHAWAEVWLPEHGWVPYDVTFGQYGWLDSSHVELKKSIDVSSSVEYSYIGNMDIGNLSIKTSVLEQEGKVTIPLDIDMFMFRHTSGFNSYIPVEVTVKNLEDYYVVVPVRISVAPGIFGASEKIVFLKPKSSARVFFMINIPELKECETGCIANVVIEDIFGNKDEAGILIERDNPKMSLQEAEAIIRAYSPVRETSIDFYCKADKEFYYNYEQISVTCNAKSQKDMRVSVCNQNVCKNVTLYANQTEQVLLYIPAIKGNETNTNDSIQVQCLVLCIITREQRDVLAVSCVDTKLLEAPQVNITEIKNTEAKYGSSGALELVVESNIAINANLSIARGSEFEKQTIFLNKGANTIKVDMKTWEMDIGEKQVHASILYEDKNGKVYEAQRDFVFVVKDVSIFEKIFVKIIHLFE